MLLIFLSRRTLLNMFSNKKKKKNLFPSNKHSTVAFTRHCVFTRSEPISSFKNYIISSFSHLKNVGKFILVSDYLTPYRFRKFITGLEPINIAWSHVDNVYTFHFFFFTFIGLSRSKGFWFCLKN